ncbi:MAG: hypothetical protein ACRDSZ_07240 [Pseudonocardiaceae bacterium]
MGELPVMQRDGKRTDAGHPAWCSAEPCFVTDEGVRVHQQAPTRWEVECVVPLRLQTCLIDPEDNDTTYLEPCCPPDQAGRR